MKYTPAQLKKVLVAGLGFLLTLAAALLQGNLIPVEWLPYVLVLIGVSSSYGVFAVTNAPAEDEPAHRGDHEAVV